MKTIKASEQQQQVITYALLLYVTHMDSDMLRLKQSGRDYNRPMYKAAIKRIEIARNLIEQLNPIGEKQHG